MVHVYDPVADLFNSTLICVASSISSVKFDLQHSVRTRMMKLLIIVGAHVEHEHTLVTYFWLMSVTNHRQSAAAS